MGPGRPDAESRPAAIPRMLDAWRALGRERRLTAIAALALFVSMLLPWYQQNGFSKRGVISSNLDAFSVFSFIEAAILLVALSTLTLLYKRTQGSTFHLPGSDGATVLAGGLWTVLLLVIRLFYKPGITTHGVAADVGLQWGIFFALGAAGLLAYAGAKMRSAERPEPPLLRKDGMRRRTEPKPGRRREPPSGRRATPPPGRRASRVQEASWGAFEPAGAKDSAKTTRLSGPADGSEEQTAITPARRPPAPGPKAVPARPSQARDAEAAGPPAARDEDEGQLSFDVGS